MKRHLPVLSILLCLLQTAGMTQTNTPENWRPLLGDGLTGPQFKILTAPARPHLLLGLSAGTSLAGNAAQSRFTPDQFNGMVQNLFRQPGLTEQLFERLGGEFLFGTPNGSGTYSNLHTNREYAFGIQAVLPVGQRWAVQAGVSKSQFSSTATFPVTVIRQSEQQVQTREESGAVRTEREAWLAETAGRLYIAPNGPVQAFAGLGLQYRYQPESAMNASLKDVAWEAGIVRAQATWAGLMQAGISVQPRHWPVFVELGLSGQLPFSGGAFSLAGQLALGWKW